MMIMNLRLSANRNVGNVDGVEWKPYVYLSAQNLIILASCAIFVEPDLYQKLLSQLIIRFY